MRKAYPGRKDDLDFSDTELALLRRAIEVLGDVTPLFLRKFGMEDGIAATCKATRRLVEEIYADNSTTEQRTQLVLLAQRERDAIRQVHARFVTRPSAFAS